MPPHTVHRSSTRWRIFLLILLLVSVNYVDRAAIAYALPQSELPRSGN